MLHIHLSLPFLRAVIFTWGISIPLMCQGIVLGTTDTPSTTDSAYSLDQLSNIAKDTYNRQTVKTGTSAVNSTNNTNPVVTPTTTDNNASAKVANQPKKTSDGNSKKEKLDAIPQTPEDIAEIMVETTNEVYKDRCACPYNGDKDGFECGVESLYYKSGGHRITCYPQDLRGQQFIFYRKNAN